MSKKPIMPCHCEVKPFAEAILFVHAMQIATSAKKHPPPRNDMKFGSSDGS